jgi:hypothetical protein
MVQIRLQKLKKLKVVPGIANSSCIIIEGDSAEAGYVGSHNLMRIVTELFTRLVLYDSRCSSGGQSVIMKVCLVFE